MWKRVALLAAIAALTVAKPSNSVAQVWDGGFDGFDGFDGFGRGAVTVTVSFPHRRPVRCCERPFIPRRVSCCERPFIPRPAFCCERPVVPRPAFCCERPFVDRRFSGPYYRPPYYYGDRFAPYAYNWNAGYGYDGYDGYDGW